MIFVAVVGPENVSLYFSTLDDIIFFTDFEYFLPSCTNMYHYAKGIGGHLLLENMKGVFLF